MATPQAENGHVDIANEIAEALAKVELSAYESKCLWVIWRQTYGWHKKEDVIKLSRFKERTGMHKSHIHRTLTKLYLRHIITRSGKRYGFQKDYDRWIEPISEFFTNSGKIYFETRKGRLFKRSGDKITHIGKEEWSKHYLKHKKNKNKPKQKVTRSGNGVTHMGKNRSLQLRTDKSTRTPKETFIKETTTKEENTLVGARKSSSGKNQVKKGKSEVTQFIDYFAEKYKDRFGESPRFSYAKDSTLIKGLLKGHRLVALKSLVPFFWSIRPQDDDLIKKNGYTIGMFATRFNRLVELKHEKRDQWW